MGILVWLEALLPHRRRSVPTTHVTKLAQTLNSCSENLSFRARIELTWLLPRGAELPMDIETSVSDDLIEAARRAARPFSVLHREEAESTVNLALSRVETPSSLNRVRATLRVDTEISEFAREQMLRDLETERQRAAQEAEIVRLTALRDTMLRDGPTARLWWLNSDPGKLLELAKYGDEFEKAINSISGSRSGDTGMPGTTEAPLVELIGLFLADLGPEHRFLLLQQLDRVFRSYERYELADRLVTISGNSAAASSPTDALGNGRPPGDIP